MNDYWNEPPDYPEAPECCDLEMDVDADGNCKCSKCGATIDSPEDIGPMEDAGMPDDLAPGDPGGHSKCCHHGKRCGNCDACDHLGDLAYDAARERRGR